jgi:AcrR family transcriptional regulator
MSSGTTEDREQDQRTPLNRERVLAEAVAVADAGGIEAVSMRKLGQALGVEAMSLYNHVASKDDLLEGMVELVWSEIDTTPPGDHWKTVLRAIAVSTHDCLLAHRWAAGVSTSRSDAGPARLRYSEAILGALRTAGFPSELTHHAYHVVDIYVTGFTLWEVGFTIPAGGLANAASRFLRELPADEFPHLTEHITQHVEGQYGGEDTFGFGLDLILDGLERAHLALGSPPPTVL